eukprot:JP441511.1.p2 GENE.JP441511.1~~JP441511.1.p2  ORF type:complete len:63 (-),score=4.09 JP441511.1:77-265(-)
MQPVKMKMVVEFYLLDIYELIVHINVKTFQVPLSLRLLPFLCCSQMISMTVIPMVHPMVLIN